MKYKELEELIKNLYPANKLICEHTASVFFNNLYTVSLNVTVKQARDLLRYSKAFKYAGKGVCKSCNRRHIQYEILKSKLNVKTQRKPWGSSKTVKSTKKSSTKLKTVEKIQTSNLKQLKPVTVYVCPHCNKMVSL